MTIIIEADIPPEHADYAARLVREAISLKARTAGSGTYEHEVLKAMKVTMKVDMPGKVAGRPEGSGY